MFCASPDASSASTEPHEMSCVLAIYFQSQNITEPIEIPGKIKRIAKLNPRRSDHRSYPARRWIIVRNTKYCMHVPGRLLLNYQLTRDGYAAVTTRAEGTARGPNKHC